MARGVDALARIQHRAVGGDQRVGESAAKQVGVQRVVRPARDGPGQGTGGFVEGQRPEALAARRPLLQQQTQRSCPGVVHEGAGQAVAGERVAQRAQRHPLVVGHVALHQGRRAVGIGPQRVGGLIEALIVPPSQPGHVRDVLRGPGGPDGQRQYGGVGRDHPAVDAATQGKRFQPEGPVLIAHVRVEGMIARFGHAPGIAPVHLSLHRAARAAAQQRQGRGAHQQFRHQVFKHRAAPGGQRRALFHGHTAPTQP